MYNHGFVIPEMTPIGEINDPGENAILWGLHASLNTVALELNWDGGNK